MADDRLADTVVRSLSGYLLHKRNSAVFDPRLEDLLGRIEVKLSEPYAQESLERFRNRPDGAFETDALRLQLNHEIEADPEFGRQLASTFGGQRARSAHRGRRPVVAIGVVGVVVVVFGGGFLFGRATASDTSLKAPATTTATVERTVTRTAEPPQASTDEGVSSSDQSSSPADGGQAGVPGDGRTYPPGQPVPLVDLPRPNDDWKVSHGAHDVGFEQFSNSIWQVLHSCDESAYSREQQFRLTNFSRIEVKAVGTDAQADPELAVRFEVFANNDNVNPVKSVVVDPGDSQRLVAELPANVFTVTLRMSLTKTGMPCRHGNAVWGEPYVIATGS